MQQVNLKQDAYAKKGLLHIQSHFVVIQTHDSDETFEGTDLNSNWRVLRRFTNDLHDVVSLALEINDLLDHKQSRKVSIPLY